MSAYVTVGVNALDDVEPAGAGQVSGAGAAIKIQPFGLKPVAQVLIVVSRHTQTERIAGLILIAQNLLFVLCVDVVQCGDAITSKRILAKISVDQSEIALIGVLIRLLPF